MKKVIISTFIVTCLITAASFTWIKTETLITPNKKLAEQQHLELQLNKLRPYYKQLLNRLESIEAQQKQYKQLKTKTLQELQRLDIQFPTLKVEYTKDQEKKEQDKATYLRLQRALIANTAMQHILVKSSRPTKGSRISQSALQQNIQKIQALEAAETSLKKQILELETKYPEFKKIEKAPSIPMPPEAPQPPMLITPQNIV